ncbi:MAG: CAP domain-containing protein [Thermoleophilaceae bacterium]|nr:CAP domain-containing protein [Thermoleophilaceae bacterium]
MRLIRRLTVPWIALGCLLAVFAAPAGADARSDCAGVDAQYASTNLAALRTAVICLTNRERVARGMAPLAEETHLDAAAQGHSEDMAEKNYFDHTDLSGGKPWDRAKAAGYASGWIGENIAAGYGTPFQVMTGWMKSSGHCANILNSPYVDIGIGVTRNSSSKYGIYWTMVLGGHDPAAKTVAVSCPAAGLTDGSVPVTKSPDAGGGAKATVTSLKRRGHGLYLVKGSVTPAARGTRVKLTVKRGKKSRTYSVKTGAGGSFTKTVRPPGGSGKVRVTAKLSG